MPKAAGFIEFEVIGWEKLAAKFSKSREYMLGAVLTAYRKIGDVLVPAIKQETPVGATGHLRNYTVYQILGKAEDMKLEVRQSAASSSGFHYGVAVRQGTRPHFPPPRALVPWVMKKLGISGEKQALKVAWAIAVKISRVGTKANPYHTRVMTAHEATVGRIMNDEMVIMLGRLKQ